MRKINNFYESLPGYFCFGCSHNNPHGLQMTFFLDGEEIHSTWEPQPRFQGYNNVLHGGIQATLMDETASWLVQVVLQTAGVTSRLEIKYKKPVPTHRGPITLRARLTEKKRNLAFIHVDLFGPDTRLCSEAEVIFYTFSREYSHQQLGFPENPDFFVEE
ncbi:MAG: PaaI family thioesterase [Bacteroidales bacterium]|nr:PaaI family thioesterase [Bacteroidales bacterium]MDD3961157.1 PaaI family thioesterase [Bacteroidales bacterium]